jgi:hypothetical protein
MGETPMPEPQHNVFPVTEAKSNRKSKEKDLD